MAKTKNTVNTKCWQGWRKPGSLAGIRHGTATLEESRAVSHEMKYAGTTLSEQL